MDGQEWIHIVMDGLKRIHRVILEVLALYSVHRCSWQSDWIELTVSFKGIEWTDRNGFLLWWTDWNGFTGSSAKFWPWSCSCRTGCRHFESGRGSSGDFWEWWPPRVFSSSGQTPPAPSAPCKIVGFIAIYTEGQALLRSYDLAPCQPLLPRQ